MRQQHDSELEMELIPRQTSVGTDSSSVTSSSMPPSSTKSSTHFMSMNEFVFNFSYSVFL